VEVCGKVSAFEHFLKDEQCYDNSFKMLYKGKKYTFMYVIYAVHTIR